MTVTYRKANEEETKNYFENYIIDETEIPNVKEVFLTNEEDVDYGNIYFHKDIKDKYSCVIERDSCYEEDVNECLKFISQYISIA